LFVTTLGVLALGHSLVERHSDLVTVKRRRREQVTLQLTVNSNVLTSYLRWMAQKAKVVPNIDVNPLFTFRRLSTQLFHKEFDT